MSPPFGGRRRRATLALATVPSVALALAVSPSAHAFEAKHTTTGIPVHWPTSKVEFEADPGIANLAPGALDSLERALGDWGGKAGAPALHAHTGDGHARPGYDGRNLVYYAKSGFAAAGSALAITVFTFDNTTGEILDTDIVVNRGYQFAVLSDSARAAPGTLRVATEQASTGGSADDDHTHQPFDLTHVFAHETGHALGLGDEPATNTALMYPFTMPGDASLRAPATDDEAGIAKLYAVTPTTTTTAPAAHACTMGIAASPRGSLAFVFAACAIGFAGRRVRRRPVRAFFVTVPLLVLGAATLPARAAGTVTPVTPHAALTVVAAEGEISDSGLISTHLTFSARECQTANCPIVGTATVWGGTVGAITQQIGEPAPAVGDHVEGTMEGSGSADAITAQKP